MEGAAAACKGLGTSEQINNILFLFKLTWKDMQTFLHMLMRHNEYTNNNI